MTQRWHSPKIWQTTLRVGKCILCIPHLRYDDNGGNITHGFWMVLGSFPWSLRRRPWWKVPQWHGVPSPQPFSSGEAWSSGSIWIQRSSSAPSPPWGHFFCAECPAKTDNFCAHMEHWVTKCEKSCTSSMNPALFFTIGLYLRYFTITPCKISSRWFRYVPICSDMFRWFSPRWFMSVVWSCRSLSWLQSCAPRVCASNQRVAAWMVMTTSLTLF